MNDTKDPILELLEPLRVDKGSLRSLVPELSDTFRNLAIYSRDQFIPTPVLSLPSGREKGRVLAIDVGGTNLRIAFLELLGSENVHASQSQAPNGVGDTLKGKYDRKSPGPITRLLEKAWPIKEALKMDNEEALFTWIGDCIALSICEYFIDVVHVGDGVESPEELLMGITFSFPMIQESISKATLMPMGKGFAIDSERDLGDLLLAGYQRHLDQSSISDSKLKMPRLKIVAIANDAVATLVSLCYHVRSEPIGRVALGVILATGSNAAIPLEVRRLGPAKQQDIVKFGSSLTPGSSAIINTEWTLYGTGPPFEKFGFVTKWDKIISESAERPGFQPFEYMTAGRYLGELVRLVILELLTIHQRHKELDLPLSIRTRNGLTTKFLGSTVIEADVDLQLVSQLNRDLPPPKGSSWRWSLETARILKTLAEITQQRSAALLAAAIVALLLSSGDLDGDSLNTPESANHATATNGYLDSRLENPTPLVVACAGGVISCYAGYLESCQSFVDALLSTPDYSAEHRRVSLREALDGGIIGAGVLAST